MATIVPFNSIKTSALSRSEYTAKYKAFITDARWKHGISWNGSQRPKKSSWGSSGCCAYAADFEYVVHGKKGWNGTAFTDPNSIKDGSILYIKTVSGGVHWIVVLERDGSSLYTAEGNLSLKVNISNGRYRISGGKLQQKGYTNSSGNYINAWDNCVLNRGYNYSIDDTHYHNYGRFYEGDHPHRVYMKCSCGDWYYTGETAAAKGAYAWYAQVHPHYNHYYCTICGKPYRDENEPNVISDCEVCNPKIKIIYGDIKYDGNITTLDMGVFLQYINKWNVTIKTDSADVNDDGAINTQDYGILMQYVNGWNVSLG